VALNVSKGDGNVLLDTPVMPMAAFEVLGTEKGPLEPFEPFEPFELKKL
jgi:hypothetical protein